MNYHSSVLDLEFEFVPAFSLRSSFLQTNDTGEKYPIEVNLLLRNMRAKRNDHTSYINIWSLQNHFNLLL